MGGCVTLVTLNKKRGISFQYFSDIFLNFPLYFDIFLAKLDIFELNIVELSSFFYF